MVARAALQGRLVAVTGRTTGAMELTLSRGGGAARCKDQQHGRRLERAYEPAYIIEF